MAVTYYIKLFRTDADRHNGFLMCLLQTLTNAIIMQTGKIVPSRSDNIQSEQVAAKRRYETEIKISSEDDNF